MDKNFERAANGWISQYSADIKVKVENLLNENDSTPEELAEVINVDVDDIYAILEGDGEVISVDTLIKVFMTLGLAIEIKPIAQTPLGGYNNVNPQVMREPQFEERRAPRPNPFTRERDFDNIPPHVRERMEHEMPFPPRPAMGRGMNPQMPFPGHFAHRNDFTSPFAEKSRDELVHIIRKHLWDSEIDTSNATKNDLVKFLDEKDRKTKEFKRTEELERDPQVVDFVKRMKQNIKDNPQFRSYMKNFLKNLDEE
jgi:hypothetical protein